MSNLFNLYIDIPDFNNGHFGSIEYFTYIFAKNVKFIFIRYLIKITCFEVKTLREFTSLRVGSPRLQDKDLIGLGERTSEQIARSGKSIRVG